MAAFSLLTASSQATIYWDFVQEGNNLRATVSGSLDTITVTNNFPSSATPAYFGPGAAGMADTSWPYTFQTASSSYYGEGGAFATRQYNPRKVQREATPISGTFAVRAGMIAWDTSLGLTLDPGEAVNAEMLFINTKLADFGMKVGDADDWIWSVQGGPDLVQDSVFIRVLSPVPEPSSSLLTCFAAFVLIARRRRSLSLLNR